MPARCTLPYVLNSICGSSSAHSSISFLQYDETNSFIMGDSDDIGGGGTPASFPPPFSSSSSSDFEFSIIRSPSSKNSAAQLCPADELFYKGQLLPLHLSPRLSLVRTLLLSSSSTSSSDATSATVSRDSNSSTSSADSLGLLQGPVESDSSRPSSVTEEDYSATKRRNFYSFTSRFSSFFLNRGNKKDPTFVANHNATPSSKKPTTYSSSAKEMIKKYVEKVKPLYEKFSSLQHRPSQHQKKKAFSLPRSGGRTEIFSSSHSYSHSFAGNLRSPYRMKSTASCPSSMRSSPSHSGLLCSDLLSAPNSSSSSMEELQSAIQAAIAHCKSTMVKQKKLNSFNDDLSVF
ncbi:putative membrane-associated kinase regulator 1 [Dendrobium catenatum]|uniref:Putative membrane-associated kinase regulator 1 n=2 Tax=Dendrobium catenatum TaxID=906689 RepID=A0A2I0VNP9_9ASPA|nr:putative membrane-associated kinase regulator 1 [Dendrobium catenatum]